MAKRRGTHRDPQDEGRRRVVVKGGLLAMASALGFWPAPGCSKENGANGDATGTGGSASPGAAGTNAIGTEA